MTGAARRPRGASGRSWSGTSGHADLACLSSTSVLTAFGRRSPPVIDGRFLQGPSGDGSHVEGSSLTQLIQPRSQRLSSLDRYEAAEGGRSQVDVTAAFHCAAERRDGLACPQPAESVRCQYRPIPVRMTQCPDQAAGPGKAGGRFNQFAAGVARSSWMIVDRITVETPAHGNAARRHATGGALAGTGSPEMAETGSLHASRTPFPAHQGPLAPARLRRAPPPLTILPKRTLLPLVAAYGVGICRLGRPCRSSRPARTPA